MVARNPPEGPVKTVRISNEGALCYRVDVLRGQELQGTGVFRTEFNKKRGMYIVHLSGWDECIKREVDLRIGGGGTVEEARKLALTGLKYYAELLKVRGYEVIDETEVCEDWFI